MKVVVFETEEWEHQACLRLEPEHEIECTAACALHRLDQIAGDGQEQGEGMLRHGRIAIIGYVRHRDAVRLAPVQIDMIVSGRPGCDQL